MKPFSPLDRLAIRVGSSHSRASSFKTFFFLSSWAKPDLALAVNDTEQREVSEPLEEV